jgi:hypothetical protein
MLMNSEFVLNHAQALARRLRSEAPAQPDLSRTIAHAWQLAYNRPISDEERDWARAFVAQQLDVLAKTNASGDRELMALTNLCQQLLTSNEFIYVD